MVGSGPLLELATLKEYLTAIKPETVLWFYFEANDLQDLADESKNPVLMRYLQQRDFNQHLMGRQAEIDGVWKQYESGLISGLVDEQSSPMAEADRGLAHRPGG